jgi:response regulator RpfG family c-di-GMP phosphodiesterase
MTPEGFVALFVVAQPTDDDVCGKALAYVNALTELKLDLLLSCEGNNGRAPGRNVETCQELLIDSTWDAQRSSSASLASDLQSLFDACTQTGVAVTLRTIVVFCSGTRMAGPDGAELMRTISQWMEERQMQPVFFLTQPTLSADTNQSAWTRKARDILVEPVSPTNSQASADRYQRFLSTCLSKQWEVFI